MRLAGRTFVTQDEEFNPENRITRIIENLIKSLKLDTYNQRYIIRITVDQIDPEPEEEDEGEGEDD